MPTIQEATSLAAQYHRNGQHAEAAEMCRRILEVLPDWATAHHILGLIANAAGKREAAAGHFRQTLVLEPGQTVHYVNLATLLRELGRKAEAVVVLRQAALLQPDRIDVAENAATLLAELGRDEQALAFLERAEALRPESGEVQLKLALLYQRRGRMQEARRCYRRSFVLNRAPAMLVREALALPIIPQSLAEIDETRRRFAEILEELAGMEARIADPFTEVSQTSFYLAYHGRDDRPLQAALADFYARACPALRYTAPHCRDGAAVADREDRRIRIGFVSEFFYGHTIAQLNLGLIEHLSRADFHVTLLTRPGPDDRYRRLLTAASDVVVEVPGDLDSVRRRIADLELDLLYYPDIGMSPFTYFLAFARLAPVQCVTWGHPDTTGIGTIDYFLTCDAMEPAGAEAHYTERLVRLPGPTVHYRRPRFDTPFKSRAELGLPEDAHLYLCPQSLFKIHPDFDEVLVALLRRDPQGLLAFVNPRGQADALLRRLGRKGADVIDRIRMLPVLATIDFVGLMATSDVMLDPLHYSGGNTSLEALSYGIPIVTWPGAYMRGRHTYGFYRLMGLEDCIARDHAHYLELALRLGTDRAWRDEVRSRILAANGVLYEDLASVRAIGDFLKQVVRPPPSP